MQVEEYTVYTKKIIKYATAVCLAATESKEGRFISSNTGFLRRWSSFMCVYGSLIESRFYKLYSRWDAMACIVWTYKHFHSSVSPVLPSWPVVVSVHFLVRIVTSNTFDELLVDLIDSTGPDRPFRMVPIFYSPLYAVHGYCCFLWRMRLAHSFCILYQSQRQR
jgi:hypothetical protein